MFNLKSSFSPTGDQPHAIKGLVEGVKKNLKNQVLIGVTGSGKTFTMANVIKETGLPTLIISHNKTLAGQLYQEFRDFFPDNAVSYFVSYYDYYQPEAYIPSSDTYIEKEAQINEMIDKLRLKSTTNILTRNDVIVVASVSCIYNIGSSIEYGKYILELEVSKKTDEKKIAHRLVELRYQRSEFDFKRGTFRVRGNRIDIYPSYDDFGYRIFLEDGKTEKIEKFDPVSGRLIGKDDSRIKKLVLYPGKHYMTDPNVFKSVETEIRADLKKESDELKKRGKLPEAERLVRKVNYDLEMIKEVGYVNGIENYSRYFDKRRPNDPPYALIDYFNKQYGDDWLLFIDESHMTVPQIRGMYNGDYSRKKTLVDFGFRLKAAYDNRPMKFEEFYPSAKKIIYVSATPDDWEIRRADNIVEQLIRPTGILDPEVVVRPSTKEVEDLTNEIVIRAKKNEKVLATSLTKKTAEDLSGYLKSKNIKAAYLHSDVDTLERSDILESLRKGDFDVLIGVNLLREGLDLPEVSLVAILDADREGFLRSYTSLIQTMGRAARNITGKVILYADKMTGSIEKALKEIKRRRDYQTSYNLEHKIIPKTIIKPIRERIAEKKSKTLSFDQVPEFEYLDELRASSLTPYDLKRVIKKLRFQMKKQAEDLNFEAAIRIRDKLKELKQ